LLSFGMSLTLERRTHRLPTPVCPACRAKPAMGVASRTTIVVFFRCSDCGWITSLRKPSSTPHTKPNQSR
jgi:hypothetical protein